MKNVTLYLLLMAMTACSTVQTTQEEVLKKGNSIAQLNERLKQADGQELHIKSPAHLNKAQEKYEDALNLAKTSKDSKAGTEVAKKGLNALDTAETHAKESEEILRLAYNARERALSANAEELFSERAKDIEGELIEAARLVEKGQDKEARAQRDEVIKLYSKLQLDSLKKGISAQAEAAFRDAKDYGAKDYAPKSFQLAKDEIKLAKTILEADRSETKKAEKSAEKAKYLSERAKQIAILTKSFERQDFSKEDIVLWYHDNLNKIADKLSTDIKYNQGNKAIISDLREKISSFEKSYENALETSRKREQKISKLEAKITTMLAADKAKDFLQKQLESRYTSIQDMFNKDEARVYREKNNIIIKAHGFYFPVGKSKIEMQNYPLVKKLIDAIYQFPDAKKIIVSGHTDSTGSNALNLRLSKERAENLEKLFESIGQIPSKKTESKGYGEKQPVESNNTKKGRNLNRRIEVEIINS
jgi:outer membrane protein OmpA-like peptidoglycan-associated protein